MSNQNKWVCVFKSNSKFEAEAVKGNIEHADIECVLQNKQDSSYLAFGYVELYVKEEHKEAAEKIINQQN